MIKFFGYRIFRALLVIGSLSLLVFALVHLVPGDPTALIGGENSSPEMREQLRNQLGLNDPIIVQYLSWVGDALRGDFGTSLLDGREVSGMLADRFPVSLQLAVAAALLAILWAVPTGIYGPMVPNTRRDGFLNGVMFSFLATPNFLVATFLVLVVTTYTRWPVFGYVSFTEDPGQNLRAILLPALTLGATFGATVSRHLRSSINDVMGQDYMRTATAKGAGKKRLILGHALRNSLVSVLTVGGLQFGILLGGTIVIEQIFGIPGMGSMLVTAINQHDYPIVQAAILALGVAYVIINLITDFLYPFIDPRIRAEEGK